MGMYESSGKCDNCSIEGKVIEMGWAVGPSFAVCRSCLEQALQIFDSRNSSTNSDEVHLDEIESALDSLMCAAPEVQSFHEKRIRDAVKEIRETLLKGAN